MKIICAYKQQLTKRVNFLVFAVFLMFTLLSFYSYQNYRQFPSLNLPETVQNNFKYCLGRDLLRSIEQLPYNLDVWKNNDSKNCAEQFKRFSEIYEVDVKVGHLKIPSSFAVKFKKWIGHSVSEHQRQRIVHVLHRIGYKLTAYNMLRSKRPRQGFVTNEKAYVMEILKSSKPSCDFCRPRIMTAEDTFGRIESRYSISAANAFKIDKWHGLFIPKKHSIFDITLEEFVDLFNVSLQWFKTVHTIDNSAQFPVLFWDMFPSAGASQVHPHVHGVLGSGSYHGILGEQLHVADVYSSRTGSYYWRDIINVHDILGLAVHYGNAVAIAPISSLKDHELLLISSVPSADLYQLLYHVIQMYHNNGSFCYSSGMALPKLDGSNVSKGSKYSLPAIIRIGTRGECSSSVNDVSSLELYTMYTVNVDPYTTIGLLRERLGSIPLPRKKLNNLFNMYDSS